LKIKEMVSEDSRSGKRQRVKFSMKLMLALIGEHEYGFSVARVWCGENKVFDILDSSEKLKSFSLAYSVDASTWVSSLG
jgi:hypothetical protein